MNTINEAANCMGLVYKYFKSSSIWGGILGSKPISYMSKFQLQINLRQPYKPKKHSKHSEQTKVVVWKMDGDFYKGMT